MFKPLVKIKVKNHEEAKKLLEHAYELGYSWSSGIKAYKYGNSCYEKFRFFVIEDGAKKQLGYFREEENFNCADSIEEMSLENFLNKNE